MNQISTKDVAVQEVRKRSRSPLFPAASAPASPELEAAAKQQHEDSPQRGSGQLVPAPQEKSRDFVDLVTSGATSARGQSSSAQRMLLTPAAGIGGPCSSIVSQARTAEVVIIDDTPEDEDVEGGHNKELLRASKLGTCEVRSLFGGTNSRSQPVQSSNNDNKQSPGAATPQTTSTSPPRKEVQQAAAGDEGTVPPPMKQLVTEKRSTTLRNRSNPNNTTNDEQQMQNGNSPLNGASPQDSTIANTNNTTNATTAAAARGGNKQRVVNSGAGGGGGGLKQSTLTFGISMEGELRKALAEKEAKVEELAVRLQACEDIAKAKEVELRAIIRSREQENANLVQAHDKEVERMQRYQQVLFSVLTENARSDRQEARRSMWERHNELGHVATVPSTVGGVKEMWVEGHFWRESVREGEALTKRKTEVEALKKAADKKLRATIKTDEHQQQQQQENSTGGTFSVIAEQIMEVEESIELFKQELDAIDRQLTELQKKRDQHDINKASFLREIRRINDEDASEFFHTETLHNGRYVVINLLGKGGFSEVWKAFDLVAARYVAVKIHKVSKDMSPQARANYLKHAERELEIMRQLEHPRLVKLYDVFELNEHSFASVMELSMGEDLDAYLKSHRFLKEHDARVILIQMVSALRYFADLENPVIHYDLKPANVLFHSALTTSFDIKITDFGLSKVIMQQGPNGALSDDPTIELTSQGTGTFWYLPPETFETGSTPRISNKVDIWAVGVIFFQMLYGKRPFAEGENQRRIWHDKLIVHRAKQLEFPQHPFGQKPISNEAKELIRKCLAFDAHDRIDVVQLSSDPYLRRKGATIVTAAPAASSSAGSSAGVASSGASAVLARRLAASAATPGVMAPPS